MGKKSSAKKAKRRSQKAADTLAARNTDEYLDTLVEVKQDESAHRLKEADKLMDEMESDNDPNDLGIQAMIREMRRLKALIEEAEKVSVEDLDKMKVEFSALMPKVVVKRAADLQELLTSGRGKAEDRTKAAEDLAEIREQAESYEKQGVKPATEGEKARCDFIAGIINERTYHSAYLELHAQAKSKRAAAFMNKFNDKSGYITIDKMWASAGFVHIMDKSGELTTLTIQDAAMRAQAIQDMLPLSHAWHRGRWTKLIEDIVRVCREAQSQKMDRGNRQADLLREVYDGVDADGNPKKVVLDDRFIHNTKKLFPLMTEDEIIAVYSDTTQGLTMKQKEKLMLEMFRRRAVEKGLNPDALQTMELE